MSTKHCRLVRLVARAVVMNSRRLHPLIFGVAILTAQNVAADIAPGRLDSVSVHSPALENNLLGDPAIQTVLIYLPPHYDRAPDVRYPVVYLLHGFNDNPERWTGDKGLNLGGSMDDLIARGAIREMMVVVPNGKNAYGGSFYTNSTTTGRWEDYIVHDLVTYVDGHYRTIASSGGRGITGHSMGGYGALLLAMKHPDIFGATYAMSPCCVAMVGDLTEENHAWHRALHVRSKTELTADPQTFDQLYADLFAALAAAFSPNPNQPPLFVDFPFKEKDNHLVREDAAWQAWQEAMLVNSVQRYATNLLKLRGIAIDYGLKDEFTSIRVGVRQLSSKLTDLGVPHTVISYEGKHGDHVRERLEQSALPFLSRVLADPR